MKISTYINIFKLWHDTFHSQCLYFLARETWFDSYYIWFVAM